MIARFAIALAITMILFVGCERRTSPGSSGNSVVRKFGFTASPDGSMRLEVTRREKSLVDFKVVDSATGKQLVADSIGSDAMRWFLHWETPTRLWGYGSDIGYFKVFDFDADGSVAEKAVDDSATVPKVVWENLPTSLQRKTKAQQGGAPNP